MLNVAEQIIADDLLKQLANIEVTKRDMPTVNSLIFRLKKIRPEYRDSYKLEIGDSKAIEHLRKLQELLEKASKSEKKENQESQEATDEKPSHVLGLPIAYPAQKDT